MVTALQEALQYDGHGTPRIMRLPAIVTVFVPVRVTFVEAKRMSGKRAAQNESAPTSSLSSVALLMDSAATGSLGSNFVAAADLP